MMRGSRNAAGLLVLLVAVGSAALGVQAADPPKSEPTSGKLSYRRIFVPQAEISSQVRGLLPLERAEFERRLAQLASARSEPVVSSQGRIERGEYAARLEGDDLTAGQGTLTIRNEHPGTHFVTLEPCNLALQEATWDGVATQTAAVGLNAGGTLVARLEGSGKLQFPWSLAGRRDDAGDLIFDLRLPPAPLSRLQLELPRGATLSATPGIATQLSSQDERTTWLVELGGHSQSILKLASPTTYRDIERVVLVRESADYTFSPAAVDVDLSCELDVYHQPLGQVTLMVESPLTLTSLRLGEQLLKWTATTDKSGATQVVAQLPEPLLGKGRTVRVGATGAWPLDRRWKLPRIRLQGAVWQEGRIALAAASSLRLQAAAVSGCEQTSATAPASARGQDFQQFQCHRADAVVEVDSQSQRAPLRVLSGTSIQVDPAQVSGTWIADVATIAGQRFDLSAQIARRWIFDSIEAIPPEALEDHLLSRRGGGQQSLEIRLRRGLQESRGVRLIVRAHRQRPAENEPFGEAILCPITLDEAIQSRQLISFSSLDSVLESRLTGDVNLLRLDPDEATPSERSLFEFDPGPLYFQFDQTAASLTASLQRAEPRYSASIDVQAQVDARSLVQTVTIRCVPDASSVGQLVVRMSPAPPENLVWQIAGEGERGLVVLPSPNGTSPQVDEAVWRLQLQRPRSTPFELRAEFRDPLHGQWQLPLVSLPEADEQAGSVEIGSSDGTSLVIQAEGVKSLPLPDVGPGRFSTTRGIFRYEPGRRSQIELARTSPADSVAPAYIADYHLESQFSSDGSGNHRALCRIENAGAGRVFFSLPSGALLQGATVDGEEGVAPLRLDDGNRYSLALPAGVRRPVVRLNYASRAFSSPWLHRGEFTAPVPEFELPTLARRWSIYLAPGLEPLDPTAGRKLSELGYVAWRRELGERLGLSALLPLSPLPAAQAKATVGRDASLATPALQHWAHCELDLPPGPAAKVLVFRPQILQAWGLALFLGVAGAVCSLAAARPAWLIAPIGMAMVALVQGPLELAPLLAGILGGLLAGGCWCLLRPRQPGMTSNGNASSPQSTLVYTGAAVTIVVGMSVGMSIALHGRPLHAAPGEPSPDVATATYRVVIPIDEEQERVGDYVYLSPGFYQELHQQTRTGSEKLSPWLIHSAHYQLNLEWQEPGVSLRAEELAAQFDLETFQPGTRVRLPLKRGQATLLPARARLDGQAIALSWSEDGSALSCEIDQPGKYRLEVGLGVAAQVRGERTELDLVIPRVPQSKLHISLPMEIEGITVPSALGSREERGATSEIVQQLGPASRLTVHWPVDVQAEDITPTVEVEQLLWWKIRPSNSALEARFRFHPLAGKIRKLTLQVDPRLQVVLLGPGAALSRTWIEPGPLNTIHILLSEAAAGDVMLQASLLFAGELGDGIVRPPVCAAVADRHMRDWTAFSAGSGLRVATAGISPPVVLPAEFSKAWVESGTAPLVAFDTSATAPLMVQLSESTSRPTVQQSAEWSIGPANATAIYRAQLTQVPLNRFQYSLAASAAMQVQQLTVYERDRPVPARWMQSADGSISILLGQSAAASQTIEMQARLEIPKNGAFALPMIEMQDADVGQDEVRLYRLADMQVDVKKQVGFTTVENPSLGEFVPQRGRLVTDLARQEFPATARGELTISARPLTAQTSGRLLTVVRREAGFWQAEVECRLECKSGELDAFRLEIPPEWPGPFEITPAVEHRIIAIPGQTRRHLLVRPPRAIAGSFQLNVRGRLSGVSSAVRAPNVNLLDVQQAGRFLALAGRVDKQRIEWETNGLQAATWNPADWSLAVPAEDETFQVVAPRFEATVKQIAGVAGQPRVQLADIAATWQRDRHVHGIARFDIEPVGLTHCQLELPAGHELVGIYVDGVPAVIHALGERTWQVRLGLEQLAQRLEVMYTSRLPLVEGGAAIEMFAPQLVGLPVDRTLWSIHCPSAIQSPGRPAGEVTLLEQDFARLESTTRAIARATSADETLPLPVAARWYAPWSRRFESLRQSVAREMARSSQANTKHAAHLRDLVKQQRAAATRLAGSGEAVFASEGKRDELASLVTDAPTSLHTLRLASDGMQTRAAVVCPEVVPAANWPGISLALVGCFAAALLLVRRGWWQDWFAAQPHVWLALVGIAWWLFAPVAWLGVVCLLAAAWSAIRSPWPQRAGETPSRVSSFRASRAT